MKVAKNNTNDKSEQKKNTTNNKLGKKRILKVFNYLNNTSQDAKKNRQ